MTWSRWAAGRSSRGRCRLYISEVIWEEVKTIRATKDNQSNTHSRGTGDGTGDTSGRPHFQNKTASFIGQVAVRSLPAFVPAVWTSQSPFSGVAPTTVQTIKHVQFCTCVAAANENGFRHSRTYGAVDSFLLIFWPSLS